MADRKQHVDELIQSMGEGDFDEEFWQSVTGDGYVESYGNGTYNYKQCTLYQTQCREAFRRGDDAELGRLVSNAIIEGIHKRMERKQAARRFAMHMASDIRETANYPEREDAA